MFSESAMVGQSRPGKGDLPRRACWVKLVSHQQEKSGRSTIASSLAHMAGETTTGPNAPAGGGDDADDCRGRFYRNRRRLLEELDAYVAIQRRSGLSTTVQATVNTRAACLRMMLERYRTERPKVND